MTKSLKTFDKLLCINACNMDDTCLTCAYDDGLSTNCFL